jgi:hypothetical protein
LALGVVNAVDDLRLRPFRHGRHCEICEATGFFEYGEFIIYTTPVALRVRIVQGPVAMNEPVGDLSGFAVMGKQAVAFNEYSLEPLKL